MRKLGLTNNQLKLLAMLSMTVDHIGYILFPRVMWLRIVGRLAFPIFAYMVAEGCSHTRNLKRYLGSMALIAAVCQTVAFIATGTIAQCIMVTFTLAIGLIILAKNALEKRTFLGWALFAGGMVAAFVATEILPRLVSGFSVDYNFIGVILPLCVYLAKNKWAKLAVCALCLCVLPIGVWWGQWFALLAIPLLALYNGQRGKWRMKWLFYFYYPAHLAVLWLLAMVL